MAKHGTRNFKNGMNPAVRLPGVLLALLVLLLAGACGLFFSRYTWAVGALWEKDTVYMDLRGEALSPEEFRELKEALPDCRILWDVPFRDFRVSSNVSSITFSDLTGQECQMLEYLPNLTRLIVLHCQDNEALEAYAARHPECRVSYPVPAAGEGFPEDAVAFTIADADEVQLEQLLPRIDGLVQVTLTGRIPGEAEMDELIASFPEVFFLWRVRVGDTIVSSDISQLDLQGKDLDFPEILKLMKRLPNLRRVELTGCPLTDEQVLRLVAAYPDCDFLWEFRIDGKTFRTDAQELDVSGWQVESPEEIEKLLPCFFNLKRVVMCSCGLDDETMDALNRRYEDIRFVWTVRIKDVDIRTDARWFYPFKYYRDMVVGEEDLYPLRYCTDMEAIDIGHMTQVRTCDWAAFMPNLEYLILGETSITDLTPLSGLKKLKYLEMFTLEVTDYSPLLGCTGLEDLNLGLTYGDPDVIAQMTWLKNLWWCDANGYASPTRREAVERMCQTLTDTKIAIYIDHPTAGGWRQLPNYFAMRDLLEMFYLT